MGVRGSGGQGWWGLGVVGGQGWWRSGSRGL